MRKFFVSSIVLLAIIFSYTEFSHARGQSSIQNSGSAGVAVATVMCAVGYPNPWVHHAQLAINADGCKCELNNIDNEALDCDNDGTQEYEFGDDYCTECIASLMAAGMVATPGSGFQDPEGNYSPKEMMYFYLQGSASQLISNAFGGSCPCY